MYLSFLLLRRSLRSIHSRRNLRTDFLRGSSGGTLFKAPLRADRIGSKGQGGHAKGHGATRGREGGREEFLTINKEEMMRQPRRCTWCACQEQRLFVIRLACAFVHASYLGVARSFILLALSSPLDICHNNTKVS